jgi:hypothetical protein
MGPVLSFGLRGLGFPRHPTKAKDTPIVCLVNPLGHGRIPT